MSNPSVCGKIGKKSFERFIAEKAVLITPKKYRKNGISMNLLTMEHITKSYTDRILLNNVAFSINENEKIGVIGHQWNGQIHTSEGGSRNRALRFRKNQHGKSCQDLLSSADSPVCRR